MSEGNRYNIFQNTAELHILNLKAEPIVYKIFQKSNPGLS